MKHLNTILAGCLIAFGMTACSNDDGNTPDAPQKGTGMYASLSLSLKGNGGRANSNAGDEFGQDFENKVGSILVVLTEKDGNDYKVITTATTDGVLNDGTGTGLNNKPKYTVLFEDYENLETYAGKQVYVFAYCNPTTEILNAVTPGASIADLEAASINQQIWSRNGFLMSNVELATSTLPDEDAIAKDYNTPEKAFDLTSGNAIPVVRSVARFDFRETNNGIYPIKDVVNGNVVANIRLTGNMALMNLANEFYYLPRIINNNVTTLCPGMDALDGVNGDYVVSSRFEAKATSDGTDLAGFFTHPLAGMTDYSSLPYTTVTGTEDDDEGWTSTNKTGYHIWRYVTENTLPQINSQLKGNTTAVVFQGVIEAAETTSEDLKAAMQNKDVLYLYNGVLVGNALAVKETAQASPVSTLAQAFVAAFGQALDSEEAPADLEKASNGFTIYRYDETVKGYPVYYVYYNRHNNNADNAEMGDMEFGVVRNNVYKLAVTDIKKFGHAAKPDDDGDPEEPKDPDEEKDAYFTVTVEVLNWVVRVNDIVFE